MQRVLFNHARVRGVANLLNNTYNAGSANTKSNSPHRNIHEQSQTERRERTEGIRRSERWSLEGKTALATGGSKGIGRAIVEELAGFGVRVHTCTNEQNLDSILDEWRGQNLHVTGSICDVTDHTNREKLVEEVGLIFEGKLDIFLSATILAYPFLKASGRGSIVSISGIGGLLGVPGCAHYGAAKGAMIQLTKTLACEWAQDMIRVNSVAPGTMRTPLAQWMIDNKEWSEKVVANVPLKRFAEPHEVAAAVAFLCMPAAAFITGQVICVDGGVSVSLG